MSSIYKLEPPPPPTHTHTLLSSFCLVLWFYRSRDSIHVYMYLNRNNYTIVSINTHNTIMTNTLLSYNTPTPEGPSLRHHLTIGEPCTIDSCYSSSRDIRNITEGGHISSWRSLLRDWLSKEEMRSCITNGSKTEWLITCVKCPPPLPPDRIVSVCTGMDVNRNELVETTFLTIGITSKTSRYIYNQLKLN